MGNRKLPSAILEQPMPITITLAARKGGSSKTTTCLNLAGACLIEDRTRPVVVVDLDAQCSLTKSLLGPEVVRELRSSETVQAVADRSRAAGDVVRETSVPNLLIVPGYPDLRVQPDSVLNLAGIDPQMVVIDTCPDTRDPAVRCALLSSLAVISPVVPEPWSLQSVGEIQSLLMSASVISNENLIFAGWLLSMVQRLSMHVVCESTLRRLHGANVFDAVVPNVAVVKEAAAAGQPVTHFAPKSAATKVIRSVYSELCQRIQKHLEREAA
jgi:chromosome partitioning protein